MTGNINQNISGLNRGEDHQYTQVQCKTCHRGQANPFMIEQVMDEAISDGGTMAAQAKYNELKEQYYGGHTYDFTGFTLAEYANSLSNDNIDNALSMAQFGVENYPGEPYAHTILGNVYLKLGKPADAIKAYQASLAIDPEQGGVKSQLEAAKKAME
ncbi:MAG: tetratricopeptide repeat protein [Kordiimonadaceae bacterium]|nr:tetratricopeptide repeat protein [Kordiimonadaceae bacterium]MBT6031073.1 tetratricopeptide repeat protein [Kordiimonadaceae bacterium]